LAAVLGGTQSLHTNGYDEALSLPTEEAAKIALRTQQIVAYDSGVVDTVDPLAGSYFIEALTDQIEEAAWKYIQRIDEMGGSVPAIEQGFMQTEIANASYKYQGAVERKEKIIVGVNQFTEQETKTTDILRINDSIRKVQSEKLARLRASRNNDKVNECLKRIKLTASDGTNLMPAVIEAVESYTTLGEIAGALREVYGEYHG
jgi:methylmalonyl-CoA mutase N-terminal domain/subunit